MGQDGDEGGEGWGVFLCDWGVLFVCAKAEEVGCHINPRLQIINS